MRTKSLFTSPNLLVKFLKIMLLVVIIAFTWFVYSYFHKLLVTQKYYRLIDEIKNAGSDTFIGSSIPPITEDHTHYPDDGRELHPGCLSANEGYLLFSTNKSSDEVLQGYNAFANKMGWQHWQGADMPPNTHRYYYSDPSKAIEIVLTNPQVQQEKGINVSRRIVTYTLTIFFGDPSWDDCNGA